MTVLYYDPNNFKASEFHQVIENVTKIVGEDIIVLPKNYDILLNASVDQLLSVRSVIDTALALVIEKNNPLSDSKKEDCTDSNIIDITKYLH